MGKAEWQIFQTLHGVSLSLWTSLLFYLRQFKLGFLTFSTLNFYSGVDGNRFWSFERKIYWGKFIWVPRKSWSQVLIVSYFQGRAIFFQIQFKNRNTYFFISRKILYLQFHYFLKSWAVHWLHTLPLCLWPLHTPGRNHTFSPLGSPDNCVSVWALTDVCCHFHTPHLSLSYVVRFRHLFCHKG